MAAKARSRLGALGTTSAHVSATAVRVSTTAAHVVAVAGRKLRVNAHSKTRRDGGSVCIGAAGRLRA